MEWMIMPLRRYADFQGRSRRLEYWMFVLFTTILYVAFFAVAAMLGAFGDMAGVTGADPTVSTSFVLAMGLSLLLIAVLLIPSLAVIVRRFHDQNLTGWFALLSLIPYLGGLIIFVFMLLPGTRGPNKFGPDPKGGDDAAVFG